MYRFFFTLLCLQKPIVSLFILLAIEIFIISIVFWHYKYFHIKSVKYALVIILLCVMFSASQIYIFIQMKSTNQSDDPITCSQVELKNDLVYDDLENPAWRLLYVFNHINPDSLTIVDKLNALQTVLNIESSFRKSDPVRVASAELPAQTNGKYIQKYRLIVLNSKKLQEEPFGQLMNIALHEYKHSYDFFLVGDPLLAQKNDQYKQYMADLKNEYDEYIAPDDQLMDDYYTQRVESDARSFASTRTKWYSAKLIEIGAVQ